MSVMSNDLIIRASAVEHELKSAFVNTLPRLVRMQMDDHSISFSVSFQKQEVFLKQLFCDNLFSGGLKYSKDEKGIFLHEEKCFASFLNSLSAASTDFNNQMITMGERKTNTLPLNASGFFAQSKLGPKRVEAQPPKIGS